MLTGMLVRVGLLLVVTGLTFIVVGWLGAVGPFLMIVGSGCAAIAFESQLAREAGTDAELGATAAEASTSSTNQAA